MAPRFLPLLALLVAAPAAAQGLAFDGVLTAVEPQVVVRLHEPLPISRGTRVYVFDPVDLDGLAVGRLAGTFRVLHPDSLDLVVIPLDAGAPPADVAVGQPVQVDLSTRPGQVEVRTDPDGARVSWNGHLIGHAPLSLELAPGDYDLLLQAPDHDLAMLNVTAEANVIIGVGATLAPASGGGR